MNILFAFQLKLILFYIVSGHPFHVSICEMNYNGEAGSIEISYRIFTDDFEEALSGMSEEKMDLIREFENEEARKCISTYINQHFEIWIKGQKIRLNYLGSELVDDAIWNYFESEKVQIQDPIKIVNSVLFEIFRDQMNLIHFEMEETKRSFRFDEDNPEVKF